MEQFWCNNQKPVVNKPGFWCITIILVVAQLDYHQHRLETIDMLGLEKRDDLQKRTMRDIKFCASVQHLKPTESLVCCLNVV